jgi:hypothetical protein
VDEYINGQRSRGTAQQIFYQGTHDSVEFKTLANHKLYRITCTDGIYADIGDERAFKEYWLGYFAEFMATNFQFNVEIGRRPVEPKDAGKDESGAQSETVDSKEGGNNSSWLPSFVSYYLY